MMTASSQRATEEVGAILDRAKAAMGNPTTPMLESTVRNLLESAWTRGYIAGIEFTTNLIEKKTS